MDTGTQAPVVTVTRAGATQVEFVCPHCKHRHVHGVASVPGHAVAHCTAENSPYQRTGYWLVLVEDEEERK